MHHQPTGPLAHPPIPCANSPPARPTIHPPARRPAGAAPRPLQQPGCWPALAAAAAAPAAAPPAPRPRLQQGENEVQGRSVGCKLQPSAAQQAGQGEAGRRARAHPATVQTTQNGLPWAQQAGLPRQAGCTLDIAQNQHAHRQLLLSGSPCLRSDLPLHRPQQPPPPPL